MRAEQIVLAMGRAGCSIEQVMAVVEEMARERVERRLYRAVARALAEDDGLESRASRRGDVTSQGVTSVTTENPVTLVTGAVTRRNPASAGAARTRRWRERQQIRARQGMDVTLGSSPMAGVTSVTEIVTVTPAPGRTPLKGVQPPDAVAPTGGAARSRRAREPNPAQREMRLLRKLEGGAQLFVSADDPAFAELGRMRSRSYPISSERDGNRQGWWFPPGLVAEARARLTQRVDETATGPPVAEAGG